MINKVIELSQSNDFYGGGQMTEIAKGKNQYCYTWRQVFRQYKRKFKLWLRR